jgi:thiamine-phosphate diphosphorylase
VESVIVVLCLVTDRHRLAPGAPFEVARRRLVEQVQWAATSRIDLIQVRERDLEGGLVAALVSDLVRICAGSATRIVVNDRVDVALACGADGVHLRHDSVPAARVRTIVPPGFLIGRSVHGAVEAAEAGPVDYLIAGTVYPTRSKPTSSTIGLRGLADIVRAATVPVLAIGGLGADGRQAVAATGAAGVAGIGLFVDWFDRRVAPFLT